MEPSLPWDCFARGGGEQEGFSAVILSKLDEKPVKGFASCHGEKCLRSEKFCFASGAGERFPGSLGTLGMEAGLGRSSSQRRSGTRS